MNELTQHAQDFAKLELLQLGLEVFENEKESRGAGFIVKTKSGQFHELFIQSINLEKGRNVKISKQDLGEPKGTLWVALVFFLEGTAQGLCLIPSKVVAKPDDHIFFENNQGEMFRYLSNWEIKVFKTGMDQLMQYSLENQVEHFL